MKQQLSTHAYQADPAAPADHRGDRPCTCGLPAGNARHDLPPAPPAQIEHRRRIGDED